MATPNENALREIKAAFRHLNEFKRFRAKFETQRSRGNAGAYEELKMFKAFDQLELSLRGCQNELRGIAETAQEENEEEESE